MKQVRASRAGACMRQRARARASVWGPHASKHGICVAWLTLRYSSAPTRWGFQLHRRQKQSENR